MAGATENYSKPEVHTVVRFLQAQGASVSEIHRGSASVYGQNVFSQQQVSVWCNKFKDGGTAPNDGPEKHRGRPRASHTATVEGFIRGDQRLKVCKMAEVTGVPKMKSSQIWSSIRSLLAGF
jgi:hypothetical protein